MAPSRFSRSKSLSLALLVGLIVSPRALPQESDDPEPSGPVVVSGVVLLARSGAKVADAEATVLRLEPGQQRATDEGSTRTGPEGEFSFESVEPGRVFVRVTYGAMAPAFLQIDFEIGEPLRFELKKPTRMQGYVIDDATGRPIEGARVGTRVVREPAVTDSEGFFDLRNVSPYLDRPTHTLNVECGDYLSAFREILHDDDKEFLDGGVFRLKPGAAMEFAIRSDSGEPIKEPRAMLYRVDLRRFPGEGGDMVTVRGDAKGNGRFGGLVLDAPFVVEVSAEGYPNHVFGPFTISKHEGVRRFEWAMTAGRTVDGEVVDEKGNPVAGAAVHGVPIFNASAHYTWDLPEMEQGWNTTTDSKGRFSFDLLAYGNFMVEIRGEAHRTWRGVMRVPSGSQPEPLRITLHNRRKAEASGVAWAPSFEKAFELAKEANLPVFVLMTMDGEVANEYYAANTFQWEAVRSLIRHTIPLLSTAFDHEPKNENENENENDDRTICAKYGSIACADHKEVELVAGARYLSEEASSVPQHVFLTPSGRKIEQRMFYLGFEALRNMIVRAVRTVNPERALLVAEQFYPDLVESLRADDASERSRALKDLLLLADHADEIARTALLTADLRGLSASEELEVLRRFLPGSAPDRSWFVLRILEVGSESCRSKALRMLAAEPTADAFEILVAALSESRDRSFEDRIVEALGVVRTADGIRGAGMNEERLARVAVAFAGLGRAEALPTLFEIVVSTPDPDRRNECALALLHFPASQVLPGLTIALEQGGRERTILARVAGELGDAAAGPSLVKLLEDTSVIVRIQAARSLGRLGDPESAKVLQEMLNDSELMPVLRVAVAAALVELGVNEGVPTLIEQADHPVVGFSAQEALRKAYAANPPRYSQEWKRWWHARQGGR